MSEYQYYEFAAVDQPLSREQQAELRARSSRAAITPGGFVNEYNWGDLKGDPLDWMARYFDAHVYSSNWGSCHLMLKLPRDVLGQSDLAGFFGDRDDRTMGGAFLVQQAEAHCIVTWAFDDDSGDYERFWGHEDGPGWMARLLPLRDELLRGDLRPLYLGWMARLCSGELDDDDLEPPVPAGLRSLSPAQTGLAEFLLLDPDLMAVAAETSPDLADSVQVDGMAQAWIAQLPPAELHAVMGMLLAGQGREAERQVRARHAAWQRAHAAPEAVATVRRTVAQIEAGRDAAEQVRLARERSEREAREAKQRAARAKHLEGVAARADAIWQSVDQTLQVGSGAAYEKAQNAVVELAEALAAQGRDAEFRRGLVRLLAAHGKRPAWVSRLTKAGLM